MSKNIYEITTFAAANEGSYTRKTPDTKITPKVNNALSNKSEFHQA